MSSTKNAPLLQNASGNKSLPHLYDPASMLQMDKEVARGFIVLMGGTPPSSGSGGSSNSGGKVASDIDDNTVTLGFLALTEGNTVEACFGVNGMVAGGKNDQGKKCARQVKSLLADAVDANEDVRKLAVIAYQRAFRTVFTYREKVGRLNVFTYCFCYRKLQKKAQKSLKDIFSHLEEVIRTATASSS